VSGYQKGKTSLDLLEQEIVSGRGISWEQSSLMMDSFSVGPHISALTNIQPLWQPPTHTANTGHRVHYATVVNSDKIGWLHGLTLGFASPQLVALKCVLMMVVVIVDVCCVCSA